MPNQLPYGFYNPNMNMSNYDNFPSGQNSSKLRELEERIRILETKVNNLEQNQNINDEYNYKYDYKTSMHMM